MNIRPIGPIDIHHLLAATWRERERISPRLTLFRDKDGDKAIMALKEWVAIRNALRLVKRLLHAQLAAAHPPDQPIEWGIVAFERLAPGENQPWVAGGDYALAHQRFMLPLLVPPGSGVIVGIDTMAGAPGVLYWLNNRVPYCSINLGESMRLHLIVDVRDPGETTKRPADS